MLLIIDEHGSVLHRIYGENKMLVELANVFYNYGFNTEIH